MGNLDQLNAALVGGDPVAREAGLSAAEIDAMRRAIVAAAEMQSSAAFWPRPMFLAATVAVTIVVGVALGAGLPQRAPRPPAAGLALSEPAASTTRVDERRQLQFATPGGTRIIWVFDPEFNP
jgi:predicted pyridoxine 5'-phosphate oxidase superfamily flavin-nucleotide-binding protein